MPEQPTHQESKDAALAAAHKFAGDVAMWANHPAKATAADYEAVRVEALRIRDLLFDVLAEPRGFESRSPAR